MAAHDPDEPYRVVFCAGAQRWTVGLVPLRGVAKSHGRWYAVHELADDDTLAPKPALTVCHDHFGVLNVVEGWPFRQETAEEVDCWVLDFPERGQVRRWGRMLSAGEYLTPRQAARRCGGFLGCRVAAAKIVAMVTDGHFWDVVGGRPGEPLRVWEGELSKAVAVLATHAASTPV